MRGGGGSGETERNGIVEAELIGAIDAVACTAADVTDGMRAAAWNSDPRVANAFSALPIRQILEPGADRWCIGQIAWSPCEQVHSAVSSCAAARSMIDGEISSAVCITNHSDVRRARAWRTAAIRMFDCSARPDEVSISADDGSSHSPICALVPHCRAHVCTSSSDRPCGGPLRFRASRGGSRHRQRRHVRHQRGRIPVGESFVRHD